MIARNTRLLLAALGAALAVPFLAAPATADAGTSPDPSPQGRVVFASTRYPAENQELYSVAGDGTSLVRLTYSETTEQHPEWSPDGTQIAFTSFLEGRPSIHVMNADGSRERRLSPGGYESDDTEPAWSPDGTRVAFASTRPYNGSWHVWVVNADGTGLRQLTGAFSTSPAWSPDGTRIAYVSAGGGISVVDVEGGNADRVTQPHADYTDERPAWSPDGTKIAFARRQAYDEDPQLFVVDADGSNERQLTTTEGASRFPSWSPDGERIVFTHIGRLSVIGADGTGMRPLLGEPWGNDLTPDWSSTTFVPEPEVPGGPTIEIYSPEAQVYPAGYELQAVYRCFSETSFVVSCDGDVPLGAPLDTETTGPRTFTVRATDFEGRTSTKTVSFEVFDLRAPSIGVVAPADGAEYEVGRLVEVDYECKDEPGGSGVQLCDGELQDGQPLDTSRPGTFTTHFWAVDNANNANQVSVTYSVVDRTPPTIAVASPQEGAVFVLGESVVASYSCEDAVSCSASPLDTSTVGAKTFTVKARDASGNFAFETRSYRVVYPFSELTAPAEPRAGEKLSVRFSLGADHGLGVVAGSAWLGCGGAGDSSAADWGLSYQAGRYKLQVETAASWSGSCRRLAITLADGTTHTAEVSFR